MQYDVGAEFERLKLEVMGLEVAHPGQVVQVLVGPSNGAWVSHAAGCGRFFGAGSIPPFPFSGGSHKIALHPASTSPNSALAGFLVVGDSRSAGREKCHI
ncbi:hypothetical protein BamIOP4010DRAFT_3347 [Burkholderia ambifaria IOP40-10]|uniref:Uncharacterized protein n=1 Tax=Burkholderia ambifaria IOP40-10 TaxID=396596 RepID=B1FH37_9BURK|nr:hypothetical protein BamIOP4010DRAFT_3347 [Burkholderia ambifaria IOP40-10]